MREQTFYHSNTNSTERGKNRRNTIQTLMKYEEWSKMLIRFVAGTSCFTEIIRRIRNNYLLQSSLPDRR